MTTGNTSIKCSANEPPDRFIECSPKPFPNELMEALGSLLKQAVQEIIQQSPQTDALWNMQQTADFLGIKKQTLSLWNSNGKGPAPTKIEGRTMYRPEIVRQYATDNTLPR